MVTVTRSDVRRRTARSAFWTFLFLLVATLSEARPYTLLWDANTDGVTIGYIVFVGTAPDTYVPAAGTDVEDATEFQLNLVPGTTYYFRVQAYAEGNVVGPLSDELVFAVPNTAPVLTNPGTQASAPGDVVSLNLLATDGNGDALTFTSVTGLPPGLSANAAGQITGTIGDGGAGVYSVTATVSDGGAQDVEAFTWRVISFTVNSPASSGSTIAANIAHGPGGVGDWVGLAPAGSPLSTYIAWKYLNDQTTRPASGLVSATVSFVAPSTGSYVVRYFRDDSLTLFAASPVTVVSAAGVSVSPSTVPPNGNVTAAVTNGPGGTADWVALYAAGAPNGSYQQWYYLNGQQSPPASGLTVANIVFTAPAGNGTYEVRLFADGGFTLLSQTSFTVSNAAPQISRDLPSVAPGTIITASVANGPGNATDWIALAPVGAAFGGYVDWRYLNGQQTPPGAGSNSATVPFTAPNTPGTYELRFYANNSATLLAASSSFTVSATAPSLTAQPLLVGPGGGIRVQVANGPGNVGDWVGMYATGASFPNYQTYKYLNGLGTQPAAGLTSAILSFVTPTTEGTYYFVLHSNNTSAILARSATFTVASSAPNIVPELLTVPPDAPVSFAVSNGPGNETDWLALYVPGAAPNNFLDWRYLNGTQSPTTGLTSANVQLTMPTAPGSYELAFYTANSYGLLARSVPVMVTPSARSIIPAATTVAAGASLNVTVANGPGNAADWIALYPYGSSGGAFVDWKYLNGQQSPPGAGSSGATVSFTMPSTPGVYQFVFYLNNRFGLLARGKTVVVQ